MLTRGALGFDIVDPFLRLTGAARRLMVAGSRRQYLGWICVWEETSPDAPPARHEDRLTCQANDARAAPR